MRSSAEWIRRAASSASITRNGKKPYATVPKASRNQWLSVNPATQIGAGLASGSTSLIQRAFSVGYSRAARLIDAMAKMGIVGQHNGSNAREIQITLEQWQAMKNKAPAAG